jgi:CheY-like chemotaxis protein
VEAGAEEASEAAAWMAFMPNPAAAGAFAGGPPGFAREAEETEKLPRTEKKYRDKNILLVEDVEINREIAMALLEDTAVSIDCAANGVEALRIFRENPEKYHCILMDIHMPEMDGFEATRRIRAIEAERRSAFIAQEKALVFPKGIPIIAMTANVFQEDVAKCLEAGMNDHLGKPIDMDEVLRKLRKYMAVPA